MKPSKANAIGAPAYLVLYGSLLAGLLILVAFYSWFSSAPQTPAKKPTVVFWEPRKVADISGFPLLMSSIGPWPRDASLEEVGEMWRRLPGDMIASFDGALANPGNTDSQRMNLLLMKAAVLNSEGKTQQAYAVLAEARARAEADSFLASEWLATIVFSQGVTALRRGENENCIECRGECSCILPIVSAAVHANDAGSRLAIQHFTEYLERMPNDPEARWLLNLAHMTLGEHPHKVDTRYLISLDRYLNSEFDIGRFRDIGVKAGVNRFNLAGGAIMDDFDNDGLLDIVSTNWFAAAPMAFLRNKGDGTFEDCTEKAGLMKQLGGLNCVQTDYNNDGWLDIFIIRGAWWRHAQRPSLLRNNGDGTFTDVTKEAGLLEPLNSISATWGDFDNDGFLDLFICCERQPNRLYRNNGNGTFTDVAARAGVVGNGTSTKGANWIDYDNDDYPDLFVNNLYGISQLFHNNRDGTFTDVSHAMGADVTEAGFSCWAWDYDNDGWLDIFATSYERTVEEVVKGLRGEPASLPTTKLLRNREGKAFEDVSQAAGVNLVFGTMGSNFGDFDNDGYLDFYLATGDPSIATLIPNRMFKNVAGKRFAEITGSSGTGHLQKGHGVACGDWDRDGNTDIFVVLGGAVNGDQYHNVLFQNPGQGNNWLVVKLVGQKSNRPAIGARIKAVTAGKDPLTVHRHVTSGSSFGANCLRQTIGLGRADRIASLEIHWPTSGTTQVFSDLAVNQAIEVTEGAKEFRQVEWKAIGVGK